LVAKGAVLALMKSDFNVPISTLQGLLQIGAVALLRSLMCGLCGNRPMMLLPQTADKKVETIAGSRRIALLPQCLRAIDGRTSP
jgi:hypothetical protein